MEKRIHPDSIRSAVIILMESIPELDALKDEAWFNAEDRLINCVKDIIKESSHVTHEKM